MAFSGPDLPPVPSFHGLPPGFWPGGAWGEAGPVKLPVGDRAGGDAVAAGRGGEGLTVVTAAEGLAVVTADRDGEGVASLLPPPQAESPIDTATSADIGARTEIC